jgi:hypothetical protein
MSNLMLMALPPAAGIRRGSGARLPRFGAGRLDWVPGRTAASLVTAGFRRQHVAEDMLLRKAEVQYVLPKCRFDNRTVDLIRPSPPGPAISARLRKRRPRRNDLKFRPGRVFCNIEPKKRQYA